MFFFAQPPLCQFHPPVSIPRDSHIPATTTPEISPPFSRTSFVRSFSASLLFFSPISGTSLVLSRLRTLCRRGKDQLLTINQIHSFHNTGDISATSLRALRLGVIFAISGWSQKYAANPFACHTYKSAPRKSFPCHTYEKHGWVGDYR